MSRQVCAVGGVKFSFMDRVLIHRNRFCIETALSLVPEVRPPPMGSWPTTAPVGSSVTSKLPPPGAPASSARSTPRPLCWGYPRWPTRATTAPASWPPTKDGNLHPDNLARDELISCLGVEGERGIALLKTR
jgi:hypothetical protein